MNHRIIKKGGWALTRENTVYHDLPIKHLWVLEIHGPKTGVGVYTEKPLVPIHTDHRIIKKLGGRLHGDGRLLGRIRYMQENSQ